MLWNLTAFRGGDRDSGSHDEHRYRQQLYGTPALSPFLYFQLVHLAVAPDWDSLRGDPRFAERLRSMRLSYAA